MTQPLKLLPERVWRTYTGGRLIDQMRRLDGEDSHYPEDWVMSVVAARNPGQDQPAGAGLSRLENGEPLVDYIRRNPQVLGRAPAIEVLFKFIDAAERLAIQVHPDKPAALRYFNSRFGKTECWHIVDGRMDGPSPAVYIGFKEGITRERWRDLFEHQDVEAMLDCLHRFEARPGDTFLIEGSVPHAIGAGCFLIEIQEPTDFTLRMEMTTAGGYRVSKEICHLGIGLEAMLDCFHFEGLSFDQAQARWQIPARRVDDQVSVLIDDRQTDCFGMNKITTDRALTLAGHADYAGLVVLSGDGRVNGQSGAPGDYFFVPANLPLQLEPVSSEPFCVLQFFGPPGKG